jgi:hypothetical protein
MEKRFAWPLTIGCLAQIKFCCNEFLDGFIICPACTAARAFARKTHEWFTETMPPHARLHIRALIRARPRNSKQNERIQKQN